MEALIVVLLIALLAVACAAVYLIAGQRRPAPAETEGQRLEQQLAGLRADLSQTFAATQQTVLSQVNAVDQRLNQRLDSVQTSVGQRLDAVQTDIGRGLANQNETIGRIGQQLGALDESAKRIMEVGQDVSSLKNVLQPPKLRGNFGEMLLEQLVKQVLPDSAYVMQYRFSDGTVVDLIIRTSDGLVPIDSKFPIDSFRRMLEATTDDERQRQRRVFLRDVRSRIEQVAKYIRPEDNTLDFALMYVPADNIYYEVIAGQEDESAMAFALERRVHLVSPNTFYAFLQVVARGFRGLQVQENAKEIIARLGQLKNDFGRFRTEFEVLGTHVGRAKNKYDDLDKLAGRLSDKLELPVQARFPVIGDGDEQAALPEPEDHADHATLPRPAIVNGGDELD